MNTMGSRIHEKRMERGLTMKELADRIGVQASAVNKWEKGIVENIKRSTIQQMADIFECSPAWLLGYDEPEDVAPDQEMKYSGAALMIAAAYQEAPEGIKIAVQKLLDVSF